MRISDGSSDVCSSDLVGHVALAPSARTRALPAKRALPTPYVALAHDHARYGRTTRSSRWTTSWGTPSGRSAVRWPATSRRLTDSIRPSPLAKGLTSRPVISTASSTSKLPFTLWTPAARRETPRESRAVRAPSSKTIVPLAPTANAIHSLRAGRRQLFGRTTVPMPFSPATAADRTPSPDALAITACTHDPEAH